jgi:glycine cleavage system H protein
MAYPTNYRYTKEHEWIDAKNDAATIGVTDYAQHELGDVVFVELPAGGTKITTGKSFGSVESVKAVSEIFAPASGTVTDSNSALTNQPDLINTDPHGKGWLIKVKLDNPGELNSLMDAAAYEAFIAAKQKEASA